MSQDQKKEAVETGLKSTPITEKRINIATSKTKQKILSATITGARTLGAVNATIGDKEVVISTPVNMPHPEEGDKIEVTEERVGDEVVAYQHRPKMPEAKKQSDK